MSKNLVNFIKGQVNSKISGGNAPQSQRPSQRPQPQRQPAKKTSTEDVLKKWAAWEDEREEAFRPFPIPDSSLSFHGYGVGYPMQMNTMTPEPVRPSKSGELDGWGRAGKTVSGGAKGWAGSQLASAGALQGLGNALHEDSREEDRLVADSGYSGYATDPLAASLIAESTRKQGRNDGTRGDGGLATLKSEEKMLNAKADRISAEGAADIEEAKKGLNYGGRLLVDLGANATQMLLDAAGRKVGLGMVPFASRAFGGGAQKARQEGANAYEAAGYGTAVAATEVITEKLFDGVANLFGKGIADGAVNKLIFNINKKGLFNSDAGRNGLRIVSETLGEGLEELLSDAVEPLARKIYSDEKLLKMYTENPVEFAYDFLVGMIMGGIGSTTGTALGQNRKDNAKIRLDLEAAAQNANESAETVNPAETMLRETGIVPQDSTREVLKGGESLEQQESVITPPETASAPEATEQAQSIQAQKPAAYGNEGRTYTKDNNPVNFRYAVMDANDLLTSNDQYGNQNKDYPAELQPRDRGRTASQMQIQNMAQNLNPELLADSATAQNGAPIVRTDGAVVGGNARTQAIIAAYQNGKAGNYVQYLKDNAARFGIDPNNMPAAPVLVRLTETDDWAGLARDLNASTTAKYSATEQSVSDAAKMEDIVKLLVPNDNGTLNNADNKEFISAFINKVVPATEQGGMVDTNGLLSKSGLERAEYAIFTYAYDSPALMERLSESLDNDASNVTNAMLQTAAKAAAVQKGIKDGTLRDIPVVDAVKKAAQLYTDAKAEGKTVEEYASQARMGQDWGAEEYQLASFIEQNKRSAKQMRDFFGSLYDNVIALGDPNQISMFGEEGDIQNVRTITEAAARQYEERTGKKFPRTEYERPEGIFEFSETAGTDSPAEVRRNSVPLVAGDSEGITADSREVGEGVSGERKPVSSAPKIDTESNVGSTQQSESAEATEPLKVGKDGQYGFKEPAGKTTEEQTNGDGGIRERGHSTSIRTDDFTDPTIKSAFEDDPKLYYQLRNKGTLQKAVDLINSVGMDKAISIARSRLDEAKYQMKKITPDTTPLVKITANELAKRGRLEEAVALETDLASEMSWAGQLGQSNAILRHSGPGGRLIAIQKYIDKINADIKNNTKHGKEPVQVKLSQELIDAYNAAPAGKEGDKLRDQIIGKMQDEIAVQMPVSGIEKINAFRYTNMLGNFKTQLRNLAGNAANLTRRKLNNGVKEVFEKALNTDEKTVSVYAGKQLYSESWADFDNIAGEMEGGKYNDFAQGLNAKKKIFKLWPLEKYRQATQWAMEKGDTIFMHIAYADALGGYLKANKIKSIADASPEMLGKARAYAMDEAMKATFHEDSILSEALSKAHYEGDNTVLKGLSKFGEAVLPFRKTPANVLSQGLEASPFGFIKTLKDAKKFYNKTGNVTESQLLSELSSNVTGTALFIAGMMLRAAGKARGAGDEDDKLSAYNSEMGAGKFAIDLNGNGEWTSLDWLAPTSLPFFMGIAAIDASMSEGFNASTAITVLSAVNNSMIEMSMLKGVADTLEDIAREEDEDRTALDVFTKAAVSAATSYATQLLQNSLLRSAEFAKDENRQTIYTKPDSPLGQFQYPVSKLMSGGLPGDFQQQEYLDVWGRPQSNGKTGERILNSFINPAIHTKNRGTEVDDELREIYKATKGTKHNNVLPQRPSRGTKVDGVVLTPDEYYDYAKKKGQMSLELVTDFVNSKEYKFLKDEEKAEVIGNLYSFAGNAASNDIRRQRGDKVRRPTKDEKLYKSGDMMGVWAYQTAFNQRNEAQNASSMARLLGEFDKLPKSMQETLRGSKNIDTALKAKEAGIPAAFYFKAYNGMAEAMEDTGSTSDVTKLQGIADSGLPTMYVDKSAKAFLGKKTGQGYEEARKYLSPAAVAEFFASVDKNGNNYISKSEFAETAEEFGLGRSTGQKIAKAYNRK